MGRALRLARPAGLLAARCAPAVPSALGSLRLWQRCGAQTAAPPTSFHNQLRFGRLSTTVRYSHTVGETPSETVNETPSGVVSDTLSETPSETVSETVDTTPTEKDFSEPCDAEASATVKRHRSDTGVVEWDDTRLRFRFWDGEWTRDLSLSPLWLRDSCSCRLCIDPHSGQKNFSTTDLPDTPKIAHAELTVNRFLKLVWADDVPSGGKPHKTVFTAEEVAAWQQEEKWQRGRVALKNPERIPWDRAMYEAMLDEGRCRVSYKDWMKGKAAFWDAFTDLRQTGLIFVTGVPTKENEVAHVANRIGPLQRTFYGSTWDVKSKPRAENVAYTSKFLGLHQDLMYHDPVPGLQLLHCLSNTCEGGESLFSHGVRAAYELKLTDANHYDSLTKHKAWFGYRKGQHHYFAARHTIMSVATGHPRETRWAPPFQGTFQMASTGPRTDVLLKWKRAATAFQEIAESEYNMVEIKLKEGECVIFDNRQILHGRRQFTTGEGDRWLKGAYISQQDYLAASTRLSEHMQSLGMALPPSRSHWKEEGTVVESLRQRSRSRAKVPEPAEIPEPIPRRKSEQAPEPTETKE
ncbi:hypothetical protein C8A00DRAFT_17986 [Chaetomidium leptoderma]|uniref:Gamma-butyrobetaine dioxygenase n=1 Tax=Chaetomidium leptoderma TaxID=669021 RepID=A0AAN6VHY6_9PEZI|nr:hypothetical protein C8A00DRAFT_17986 [Chaetomidium leptoderma]